MTSSTKAVKLNDGEIVYVFENPRARKRKYWQFIQMIAPSEMPPDGTGYWTADDCIGLYCSKCGIKMKFTKGSNIVRRHMHLVHMSSLEEYDEKEEEEAATKKHRPAEDFFVDATPLKRMKQQAEQEKITELLAQWIASSYWPYSIVEDQGLGSLIDFVSSLQARVSLPPRTHVNDKVAEMASRLRIKLKNELETKCDYYSFTTDTWSSSTLDAYMSFKLFYCTEDFNLVTWTLEARHFHGSHTGEMICAELNDIMECWSLEKRCLTMAIRDNASNSQLGMDLMRIEHVECLAHSIQLVIAPLFFPKKVRDSGSGGVTDDMIQNEVREEYDSSLDSEEKNLIDKVASYVKKQRALAKYFVDSTKGAQKLMELQRLGKGLSTILDCKTRWGSTYDMLERNLALRNVFTLFSDYIRTPSGRHKICDFNIDTSSNEEWYIADALKIMLKPFKDATTCLGEEKYPTLPLAFPCLHYIKKVLSNEALLDSINKRHEPSADAIEEAQSIRRYLLKHFSLRFRGLPSKLMYVSILHPRNVRMKFLSDVEKERAKNFLLEECIKLQEEHNEEEKELRVAAGSSSKVDSTYHEADKSGKEESARGAIFGDDSDDDSEECFDEIPESSWHRTSAIKEIRSYFNLARCSYDKNDSALQWWKKNHHHIPMLSRVARKWLGTPCTSVPSERAFSSSGNVVNSRRTSLKPADVRDLVFLHDNLRK